MLQISSGEYSDAGIKPQNEDNCGIYIPDEPLLTTKGIAAAVADGMSGSDAGKEASEACVHGFLRDYYSTPESWSAKTSAQKVLGSLNNWLHGQGQRQYGSHKGMVSTFSGIIFKSNTAYIFHVGDTRIYRLRNNELTLLTHDHRIEINDEKNYLTRAMGIEVHVDIDYKSVTVEKNDLYILTTDGVNEFLTDERLKQKLVNGNKLDNMAREIVNNALSNNSNDNLTCLITKVESLPSENETEFYKKLTALPFPPPLEPGMILDGYKIIRLLYSNKRTEVYVTYDKEIKKHVVLKAPSVNYSDDAEYINRFLHEEWAGRRINNNHVLKVLEPTRKRTALYFIAEYIEGQTLREWMDDNHRPPLNTVRNFISQIAQGLRAFHRQEMIHQDLKPENILVDKHGTLKIIDFGSTKIAGIDEIYTPVDNQELLGTLNYTAPEYHMGERPTNRADIYSLGVIAYEITTGRLPYNKIPDAKNIRKLHYLSAKQFVPETPYWVDKAIQKSVMLNPEQRFSMLSEFIHALSNPDSDLIRPEHVPLIRSNPIKVWQILALVLLVTNLITLYFLFNNS